MILATIDFPNGRRLQFADGRWTSDDAALVAEARSFSPSRRYVPTSLTQPAVVIAGKAGELAASLGGKLVYLYSPDMSYDRPNLATASLWGLPAILATIEFPDGSHIHFGPDRHWTGNDPVFVAMANAYAWSARYYPNFAAGIANEVAACLGGKVVFVISFRNDDPPDTVY